MSRDGGARDAGDGSPWVLSRLAGAAARWRPSSRRIGSGRDAVLGDGVWRRAHDRFRRAVDRYHQVMEGVPAGAARDHLEQEGTRLAAALDAVHAACADAEAAHPSASLDVPGHRAGPGSGVASRAPGTARAPGDPEDPRDLHRRLSRAGGLAAQAAEAAALVRVAASGGVTDDEVLGERLQAVTRAVDRTQVQLD